MVGNRHGEGRSRQHDHSHAAGLQLLASGETYALIGVGLGGTYLQQLSFQAGALHTSLPIMTVLEPMIAAILGVT
jgi:hypothetical protein